jgi:hypothetical protein
MEKQTSPAIKGLLISLALIVISIAVTITKQETNRTLGLIPIAVFLGGIIWATLSYSKQMDGNVTFGNVFSHGFKASALVAAVASLWAALSLGIIFPDSLDRVLDAQRVEMLKQNMDEDQIEKAMGMARKIAIPMGTIFTVIVYLFLGAIASLIGAALAKKNPNPVFPEQTGN